MVDSKINELQKRTAQVNTGQVNVTQPISLEPMHQEPQSQMQAQQIGPNPYEEKFHSEFSFISLILGVFGLLLPLFSPLAIIFGVGGLMQTHREHMKGKWMAVTGIVLGFFGIILIVVAIIFGIGFLENYLLRFGGLETLLGEAGKIVGQFK